MAIGAGSAFLGLFCSLIVVYVQESSSKFLKSDTHYHIRMTGFVSNKPSIDTLNILIEQKGFYNLNIDMDRNESGYNLILRLEQITINPFLTKIWLRFYGNVTRIFI